MNELKNQINNTRAYLAQNKMFSELEGFDAAIRLFADANKKTFKQKAAEVWKKHKGKILAGAGVLAAGGLGYGAYKGGLFDTYKNAVQKQESKIRSLEAEENSAKAHGDDVKARELHRQIIKEKELLQNMIAAEKEAKAQREAIERGAQKEKEYKEGISNWASDKWNAFKDYTSDWWAQERARNQKNAEELKELGSDLSDIYNGRKAKEAYEGKR